MTLATWSLPCDWIQSSLTPEPLKRVGKRYRGRKGTLRKEWDEHLASAHPLQWEEAQRTRARQRAEGSLYAASHRAIRQEIGRLLRTVETDSSQSNPPNEKKTDEPSSMSARSFSRACSEASRAG